MIAGSLTLPATAQTTVWTQADEADRRAVERCQAGDLTAYAEIVVRHQERLMATAFHLLRHADDAADAVQETYLRAYRALDSYDHERRFGAWLSRIAVNVCISTLRARQSRPATMTDEYDYGLADGAYVRTEQGIVLRQALAGLDPQDRAMLLLRHVHQLTSNEIGEIVHLPPATVRTRLARARDALRATLPAAADLFDPDETDLVGTATSSGEEGHR